MGELYDVFLDYKTKLPAKHAGLIDNFKSMYELLVVQINPLFPIAVVLRWGFSPYAHVFRC